MSGFFLKGFSSSPLGKLLMKSFGWANAGINALNLANSVFGASNKTGNALSSIGGALGSIPTPYTQIGGAVLGAAGAVANGFTDKVNLAHQNSINSQINNLATTNSNASDYYGLLLDYKSLMNNHIDLGNLSDWGDIGIFSSGRKVKRAREEARQGLQVALQTALNNLNLRGQQINQMNFENAFLNLMAFGGPMDFGGGAIGYNFMNRYLLSKENPTFNDRITSMPNSFSPMPLLSTFANGGNLGAYGADWTNGLTYINNGGTHELNPFEGVQMGMDLQGVPNLVELDEVVWNDYVFSNRLKVPKKFKETNKLKDNIVTFADAAREFGKESEERPNDPISRRGLDASMANLAIQLEQIRVANEKRKYARGGRLGTLYDGTGALPNSLDDDPYFADYDPNKDYLIDPITGEWLIQPVDFEPLETSNETDWLTNIGKFIYRGIVGNPDLVQTGNTPVTQGAAGPEYLLGLPVAPMLEPLSIIGMGLNNAGLYIRNKVMLAASPLISLHINNEAADDAAINNAATPNANINYSIVPGASPIAAAMNNRPSENIYTEETPTETAELRKARVEAQANAEFLAREEARRLLYRVSSAEEREALSANVKQEPVNNRQKTPKQTTPTLTGRTESHFASIKEGFWPDWKFDESSPDLINFWTNPNNVYASDPEGLLLGFYNRQYNEAQALEKYVDEQEAKNLSAPTNIFTDTSPNPDDVMGLNTSIMGSVIASRGLRNGWGQTAAPVNNVAAALTTPEVTAPTTAQTPAATQKAVQPQTLKRVATRAITQPVVAAPAEPQPMSILDMYQTIGFDVPAFLSNRLPLSTLVLNADANLFFPAVPSINLLELLNRVSATLPKTNNTGNISGVKSGAVPARNPGFDTELLRYAPIVGSAIGLALNLASRPDYSNANMIQQAANRVGRARSIGYNPIGRYLSYNPFDITYQTNMLNSQAAATNRAILQLANGNIGATMLGLLASNHSSQAALGEAYRNAVLQNIALKQAVELFNRATDQTNAEMGLKAAMANQLFGALADAAYMSGMAQVALMRQAADMAKSLGISGNFTGLFLGAGDVGRELMVMNMIERNPYLLYTPRGDFKGGITAANGGYLTIRNKRKGGRR